jgi:hypothetical protein
MCRTPMCHHPTLGEEFYSISLFHIINNIDGLKPAAHEATFLAHCSNRPIESNVVARRRRGNVIAPFAVNCNTSCLPRAIKIKQVYDRSNKLRARSKSSLLPLKTFAHGAICLLSTKLLSMSNKSCLVCCGLYGRQC